MRFDLAQWAKRSGKRRSVVLRPLTGRKATEQALYRIIAGVLADAEREHRGQILAAAEATRSTLTQDMGVRETMELLRKTFARLTSIADGMISRLFRIEAARHSARWIELVNAAIGVNLAGVVSQVEIAPSIDLATQKNVALIKGLSEEVAKRVETQIIDLLTQGKSNAAIAEALDQSFAFGKRRAALIARDQAAKFNGNLNRIRQTQAGITEYLWWTVQDERVRGDPGGKYPNAKPSHFARHGKKFRWDDPPSDGSPGEPINCRCIPRPVIEIE